MDFSKEKNPGYKNLNHSQMTRRITKRVSFCDKILGYINIRIFSNHKIHPE